MRTHKRTRGTQNTPYSTPGPAKKAKNAPRSLPATTTAATSANITLHSPTTTTTLSLQPDSALVARLDKKISELEAELADVREKLAQTHFEAGIKEGQLLAYKAVESNQKDTIAFLKGLIEGKK